MADSNPSTSPETPNEGGEGGVTGHRSPASPPMDTRSASRGNPALRDNVSAVFNHTGIKPVAEEACTRLRHKATLDKLNPGETFAAGIESGTDLKSRRVSNLSMNPRSGVHELLVTYPMERKAVFYSHAPYGLSRPTTESRDSYGPMPPVRLLKKSARPEVADLVAAGVSSERLHKEAGKNGGEELPARLRSLSFSKKGWDSSNIRRVLDHSCPPSAEAAYPVRVRNLKQYFSSHQLNEAFSTKYAVVDKVTGKTEIMTQRRPGKANAVVNVADFDAYKVMTQRETATRRYRDHLANTDMGVTTLKERYLEPKRFSKLAPLSKRMVASSITSQNEWWVPSESAYSQKGLGFLRRKLDVPWNQTHPDVKTEEVVQMDDGIERLYAFGQRDVNLNPIVGLYELPPPTFKEKLAAGQAAGVATLGHYEPVTRDTLVNRPPTIPSPTVKEPTIHEEPSATSSAAPASETPAVPSPAPTATPGTAPSPASPAESPTTNRAAPELELD